jgi:hypothetical protein
LPSAGAEGARIFSRPAIGIRAVDISSSNTDGWNFAIDNVMFVATPEPGPGLLLSITFLLLWILCKARSVIRSKRFLALTRV